MSWRTVFMGTPEIAVPALRTLAARSDVQLVITQPDRPAGRGRKLQAPAVKRAAQDLRLPVWQPERLRDHAADPRLQDMDLFVVMAYGEILTESLLRLPRFDCINLHASLLPAWRGASPLQAAIRAGDARGGVTVMGMVRALDAGPIYLQEAEDLPSDLTLPVWHDRVAELAATALARFLEACPQLQCQAQDESRVSYCGKLGSAEGHVDFTQPASAVERHIRAYTPVPGCWALTPDGQRLRITAAKAVAADLPLTPGTLQIEAGAIRIACAQGSLELLEVQPPGRPRMSAQAWRNGYRLPERLQ